MVNKTGQQAVDASFMSQKTSGKNWSTRKKVLVTIAALVIVFAAVYIYIATETYSGTKSIKADYELNAVELLQEFRTENAATNQKYADKIILVRGVVTALEEADSASVNIKIEPAGAGGYLIFAFQEQYLAEARTVRVGDSIAVKGSSSGSSYSEILDTYMVPFKRSTLVENYSQSGNR